MPKTLRELYDDLQFAHQGGRQAAGSDEAFVIKLVQLLLTYGVQVKASDIHIEPGANDTKVRYRIDGILYEMLRLSNAVRDPLIRSLKIKASMATDVVGRSKPQDSRIDFEAEGQKLDLRVSSFPTLFGDVLAIRILNRSIPLMELEQLGFPPSILKEYLQLIHRPNGLLLVTGPANSGKTTTLYGALNKLRSSRIKIVTLEDPVEYQMDGVAQAQINPAMGLTFASGLRAILRQDANVILVGEIRDKETAEIAIRAALTGHLVFSTMHTRHSLGATTRLLDMEIEPHLIVGALNGVIAQRLVRLVCVKCKAPDPTANASFERLWSHETNVASPNPSTLKLYKSVGCATCNQTGYQGRLGIFELMILTDELKRLVLDRASGQLYKAAVASGRLKTMMIDGLEKVAAGITTIEEVLRVTGEGEYA